MGNHPIDGLMSTAMQNIKEMVDVDTIVGAPVESPDGSVIIPISRVAFGFAAGGSEFGKKPNEADAMFGGGSGGGVSISPVAFMVVGQGQIKLLPIGANLTPVDRILDFIPGLIEKINDKFGHKKVEKVDKKKPVTVEAVFND
ncbi:MAG: sporulation protein YtfJ [Ruminococcaceae bacterium]|nr:sporulation protein YtfJ [Oscillospiraceae bacterium]